MKKGIESSPEYEEDYKSVQNTATKDHNHERAHHNHISSDFDINKGIENFLKEYNKQINLEQEEYNVDEQKASIYYDEYGTNKDDFYSKQAEIKKTIDENFYEALDFIEINAESKQSKFKESINLFADMVAKQVAKPKDKKKQLTQSKVNTTGVPKDIKRNSHTEANHYRSFMHKQNILQQMVVEQSKLNKDDISKMDIADIKITNITRSRQLDKVNHNNILDKSLNTKTDEELILDEILKDTIEYGTNFEDQARFNKDFNNDSDSDDMHYTRQVNNENLLNLPPINVYNDIGQLSREVLTIDDEKKLRKTIAYSHLNTYWNKQETKNLTEGLLVGCVANKIPATTLLYAIKLNTDRQSIIKQDIEYYPTSESDQSSYHGEQEDAQSSIFNHNPRPKVQLLDIPVTKFSNRNTSNADINDIDNDVVK